MSDLTRLINDTEQRLAELKRLLNETDGQLSVKKKPAKRPRKQNAEKAGTRPRTCSDKAHGECRMVPVSGGAFELIYCPWCDFLLSPSNAYKWCGNCYTLYEIVEQDGYKVAHFGKGIAKPFAVSLAIAMAKSGGMRFGEVFTIEVGEDV